MLFDEWGSSPEGDLVHLGELDRFHVGRVVGSQVFTTVVAGMVVDDDTVQAGGEHASGLGQLDHFLVGVPVVVRLGAEDAGQLGMIGSVLEAVAGEMKRLGIETSMAFVYSGPQGIGYRLRW